MDRLRKVRKMRMRQDLHEIFACTDDNTLKEKNQLYTHTVWIFLSKTKQSKRQYSTIYPSPLFCHLVVFVFLQTKQTWSCKAFDMQLRCTALEKRSGFKVLQYIQEITLHQHIQ